MRKLIGMALNWKKTEQQEQQEAALHYCSIKHQKYTLLF
ncbi:hypothetical protein FM109_00175 [Vibrio casei]|nr:hypothetical protein FM109_00175 [Vibrio casei]